MDQTPCPVCHRPLFYISGWYLLMCPACRSVFPATQPRYPPFDLLTQTLGQQPCRNCRYILSYALGFQHPIICQLCGYWNQVLPYMLRNCISCGLWTAYGQGGGAFFCVACGGIEAPGFVMRGGSARVHAVIEEREGQRFRLPGRTARWGGNRVRYRGGGWRGNGRRNGRQGGPGGVAIGSAGSARMATSSTAIAAAGSMSMAMSTGGPPGVSSAGSAHQQQQEQREEPVLSRSRSMPSRQQLPSRQPLTMSTPSDLQTSMARLSLQEATTAALSRAPPAQPITTTATTSSSSITTPTRPSHYIPPMTTLLPSSTAQQQRQPQQRSSTNKTGAPNKASDRTDDLSKSLKKNGDESSDRKGKDDSDAKDVIENEKAPFSCSDGKHTSSTASDFDSSNGSKNGAGGSEQGERSIER